MTELEVRARKSVEAFRAMIPSLNGYVQAITGRKSLVVVPAAGAPRTDGKKIYFPPPIGLGDRTEHVRALCDKRNAETKYLICPACNMREQVLASLYHEVSHIVFGTVDRFMSRDVERAMLNGMDYLPNEWRDPVASRLARNHTVTEPMLAASLVSRFLPVLVNALEDVRVDTAMFAERRGIKIMHQAKIHRILNEGIEQPDGSVVMWNTRSRDAQAMVATMLRGMGMDVRQNFIEEIAPIFDDEVIANLMAEVPKAKDALQTLVLSFGVFARLQEMGFLKSPDDPQPESEPEPEPESEPEESENNDEQPDDEQAEPAEDPEDEAADPGDSGEDPEDGGAGGDDDSGDDGKPEPDGSGSHDSGEPDPESDEAEPEGDGGAAEPDADGGSADADSGEDESSAGPARPDTEDAEGGDSSAGERSGEPEDEELNDGEADGGSGSDHQEQLCDDDGDGSGPEPADRGDDGEPGSPGADGTDGDPSDSEDESDSVDDCEAPGAFDSELDEESPEGSGDPAPWDESEDGDDARGPSAPEPIYCDPDEADRDLRVLTGHLEEEVEQTREETDMVEAFVLQGDYFETPSTKITGVRVHEWDKPTFYNGRKAEQNGWDYYNRPKEVPSVGESVLGPALLEMRRTFQDNARADHQRHLRSGRADARVLGKRAWAKDDRLFQKKRLPGKRSYAVLLGLDISGSTNGPNIRLIKRAAAAQAELCDRLGIDFSIYAHTANPDPGKNWGSSLGLDIYEVKKFGVPWSAQPKKALAALDADAENLDGHTIEFYRRMIDRSPATDKIILYYTDGKMPAANHSEELQILQREIRTCKQKGITLMGVGIRTSSPKAHGLDTVRVDSDSDMVKVVRHLESALGRVR